MRAVFDLDDTICIHSNRDYPNAKPVLEVIEKIRRMKIDGWEIVIYSARGQISCDGCIEEIERRNRSVVEEWLKKHNVPFDELIFGKPIADLYVDDKGMSLEEFLRQPFYELKGGSGKNVYRQGNLVRKDFGSEEEAAEFKKWVADNKGEFLFPKVISYVYNTVYMEYIEGFKSCDIDAYFIPHLVDKILECKKTSPQEFDINKHIERLMLNITGDKEADDLIKKIAIYLKCRAWRLKYEGSFCHGDLTLNNMIVKNGEIYVVDARNTTGANSYLLDLAKLRMSLNGYERIFGIANVDNSHWSKYIDVAGKKAGLLKDIIALEIMFIFRCYRYINPEKREALIKFAMREAAEW